MENTDTPTPTDTQILFAPGHASQKCLQWSLVIRFQKEGLRFQQYVILWLDTIMMSECYCRWIKCKHRRKNNNKTNNLKFQLNISGWMLTVILLNGNLQYWAQVTACSLKPSACICMGLSECFIWMFIYFNFCTVA